MPETYQDYLAANVLNQGAIISYRSLSRALKVHSNAAKQMLYDFYSSQNARKPSSVHATYLLAGIRKPPQPKPQTNGDLHPDGEDTLMSDTSFMMSSSMPEAEQAANDETIRVTTVTLVAEEQLDEIKATYESLTSIHIYSLEPGPLANIRILADCNRKLAVDYASEDPLESWKQYGTIHNPNVKRRTNRRPPPPTTTQPQPAVPAATTTAAKAPAASKPNSTTKATPQTKRESSDLFKSFAKGKTNGPQSDQQQSAGTHSNAAGSLGPSKPEPPTAEDESMKEIPDLSSEADDEGDDESDAVAANLDTAAAKERAEANRKAKLDREANLRKMMEEEEDDDDDDDAKDTNGDTPMADADAEPEADSQEAANDSDAPVDTAAKQADEEQVAQVTVSDGRRRGRRRVMKKRTTKDAEGYLVTKEEPVWESFSEDDVPAATSKPKPISAVAAKGKKPTGTAAKPGQGNIMKFFGKK